MSKNLVIVESPAKAKTIEGYLGKDYKVASSYGHVRDLQKGNNAIDIANGFTPTYEVSKDKKEVIRDLKKLAKAADTIYLASDDDREGEAISWHLQETLKLEESKTKRIVFHEITKNAISKAINNPRALNVDLVNAQQARRVLDRLVGFELSPILWKKIKTGLSAGRVQSVAVRLVVDREREIDAHQAVSAFKVTAEFSLDKGKILSAELPAKFKTKEEAETFVNDCVGASYDIKNLEKKPGKKTPAPPFTTSTIQQEASRKLGFSVARTMSVAQKLYEAGKISYMRTDSLNLSDEAIAGAKNEITSSYGEHFVKTRKYKTKNASAQEAHEAIRPTNFSDRSAGSDDSERRLYELIWKRAIASQMADAEIEKTVATIGISTRKEHLTATGEVVKFEGFLTVYTESTDDDTEEEENKGMLPPLEIGQDLDLNIMKAKEGFTRHAARYTEASLVKKMEEMGIGRPSTYAPTISTIQRREYVVKEARDGHERKYAEITLQNDKVVSSEKTEITGAEKNKLFPTNIAMIVNDFLVDYFPNVIDYSFTANVEKEFDEIAHGLKNWNAMIESFYGGFHKTVEETEQVERSEIGKVRELGDDPATGKPIIARMGRFGAMVQMGETSEDEEAEKPKYASLRKGQFLDNITLEDALELFKLPRQVGELEDKVMTAAIGRFGPYIRHDGKFVSIPKDMDPLQITADEAVELIMAKRKSDAEKFIKGFDENPDVQVLNGRWGPYIKFEKKNVKIPKDKEPTELTYAECVDLAEKTPDKKGRGATAKKKAPAKTTAKATKPKATKPKTTKAKKK
ncbi:type I DNA topoisomerase [Reichenbachiella carrageenanivorans]|uniref:DNA topoisomerase 1 n=1 Tax=Reichenbachiella carrageenanivorans TaxID=2979869 RepID=A0ABY6CY55_9BACT|nr:type I DNA topoisomerase [Reichenbachiella carrageenanivorans]UXX78842.1 type I DNA topoisomerase [Reichenbachiella carrageenanivorans]